MNFFTDYFIMICHLILLPSSSSSFLFSISMVAASAVVLSFIAVAIRALVHQTSSMLTLSMYGCIETIFCLFIFLKRCMLLPFKHRIDGYRQQLPLKT